MTIQIGGDVTARVKEVSPTFPRRYGYINWMRPTDTTNISNNPLDIQGDIVEALRIQRKWEILKEADKSSPEQESEMMMARM